MKFSKIEIKQLSIAWIVISLAFAIAFTGANFTLGFIVAVIASFFTVGVGFIFHELGHKYVAQKYGCYSEFRANYQMLLLAIVLSFFGFIFAAPGAVMISGHVTKSQYGKISAAGPFMSLVIALFFLMLLTISKSLLITGLSVVFFYGALINSWLALFNLLPFGILDGQKILAWNKKYYGIMVAVSILFLFLSYTL